MPDNPASKSPTFLLGIAFLLIGLVLAYLLVAFWPHPKIVTAAASPNVDGAAATTAQQKQPAWDPETTAMGFSFRLDPDVRLLILVLLAGALGSYIHAVQSFTSYVGNSSFKTTWTWWYILRLPVGATLALFIYFVVRGGLLAAGSATASGAANDLNLYGIMSFSGLAGLFSKQAADKLSEVFDTLFATKEDRKREDKLGENPRPEVASVSPDTFAAGVAEMEITLTGQGFVKDSFVKASGKKLPTAFKSAQSLTARITANGFSGRSEIEISVVNPTPGGGESDPVLLKIQAAGDGLASVTPISGGGATGT